MKKYLLVGLIVLHLFLLYNLQFTAWPEMLSYPYLRNNGFLLYKDMIHPYPPVLTMVLSLSYKLFGYKLVVLKVVTWATIIANDVLIFLIVKKLTKKETVSLFSVGSYVLLQPFLEGNTMWFDLAIVPFVLLGLYFFLEKSKNNLIASGLFFAVAALIKQTSGLFLIINSIYLLLQKNIRGLIAFLAGSFVLGSILLIRLWTEGAVQGFFNWTLVYPFKYWSKFPGYVEMELTQFQFKAVVLLLLPILGGIVILRSKLKDDKLKLLLVYIVSSLVMVYPRFSFFHFQLALALIVITVGYLAFLIKKNMFNVATLVIFIILVFMLSKPNLTNNWNKETRFWNKKDLQTAEEIKKVAGDEKIFMLGQQSTYYVYSDTLPPKPWTDNFGWYLEIPGVQEEIVAKWDQDMPAVILTRKYVEKGPWYGLGTYAPQKISAWVEENYELHGEIIDNILVWQRK